MVAPTFIKTLRISYAFLMGGVLAFLFESVPVAKRVTGPRIGAIVGIVLAIVCLLACAFLIYVFIHFCVETVRLKKGRRKPL
jgi:hypothetical protein